MEDASLNPLPVKLKGIKPDAVAAIMDNWCGFKKSPGGRHKQVDFVIWQQVVSVIRMQYLETSRQIFN